MSMSNCPRHTDESWINCALCRASRTGLMTYMKAQSRSVNWRESFTTTRSSSSDVVEEQHNEQSTSFEDAFSTMMNCLELSSLKCGSYHCSNTQIRGSLGERHHLHYHGSNFRPVTHDNQVNKAPKCIHMTAVPGTYTVSAVREGKETNKHSFKVEPGRTVNLTIDL